MEVEPKTGVRQRTFERSFQSRTLKGFLCAALVHLAPASALDSFATTSNSDFEQQYEKLTVQVLLSELDFEQHSLKYRIDALRDPKTKIGGCSLASGITGSLAFETWNLHQLKRKHQLPQQLMEERLKDSNELTARLLKRISR